MFRPRWRKVLSDLWGNKARTLLVIASIAVGVLAIGLIVATYVILMEDMNGSYLAANPPNINMLTSPFDADFVEAIRDIDGVAGAEGRRSFTVQVQLASGEWDELKLTAVPDFEDARIYALFPIAGNPVPDDQMVVLEHISLDEMGFQIGDALQVELSDGTVRELPIAGTVRDQSDVYSTIMGDLQGFISFDTLEWLHQPDNLNRFYVTVAEDTNDKAHIRDVATEVTDKLERNQMSVYQTRLSRRDEHPLGSIIDALAAIFIILGVLTVFLSGSLIANTMSALLNQHLRQIGVMKLVGARRQQVVGMYVALIMSFCLIALLLAIPAGMWGGYELSKYVASVANFELRDFQVIPQAVMFQIVIGLLVPPIAGLRPVLKGAGTTVQKAISSTGLGDGQGKPRRSSRGVEGGRFISRPLVLSIRNTFRQKGRLALTLFTLTLGGAIFIAVFSSQASQNNKMHEIAKYFGADVNLNLAQTYRIDRVTLEALAVPGVVGVEAWLNTSADIVRDDDAPPESITIVAPPSDTVLVDPTLLAGRWLAPGDETAITVNEAFLEEYPGLQPGDQLRLDLGGHEENWTIVGVFQYMGLDQLFAYANYEYVSELLDETQHASSFHVITEEHSLAYQESVAGRLDQRFRDLGYQVSTIKAGGTTTASAIELLGIITSILLVMALMTALVGVIGLTGTMSMNVMDRTREIGVMRAIGAYNSAISRLVIVEGLIIGMISYVLAALLSIPITIVLSNAIMMAVFKSPAEFALSPLGFLIWLAVVLVLAVIASLAPARNATRLTIREVLAYE